jgi:hypothetical protein
MQCKKMRRDAERLVEAEEAKVGAENSTAKGESGEKEGATEEDETNTSTVGSPL